MLHYTVIFQTQSGSIERIILVNSLQIASDIPVSNLKIGGEE